jgi:phosphatidylserine/phosphatidylglycerophosphate/cardiolipin synthase-like enzyme
MKKILLTAFAIASLMQANAQTITCAAARAQGTGAATITGVVTNGAEISVSGGSIRYIQDATGGAAVYGTSMAAYNRGDSITVSGTLTQFSGLMELTSPNATLVSAAHTLPAPLVGTTNATFIEANEGKLIRLNNVTFSNTGNFSGNKNYDIAMGGNNTEDIRINSASNLVGTPIPNAPVDVIGILSEYNVGTYTGTSYQLLLRDINDIIFVGNPPVFLTPLTQSNITQTSFDVSFKTQNNGNTIVRYGLTPTALTSVAQNASQVTNHTVSLTGLSPATVYYVQGISVSSTNDTSKSNVQAMVTESTSSGKMIAYFNNPVDNSKAQHGNMAQYLPSTFDDTLIAFFDRAVSTLDIAIYNVDNNLGVITAINNAVTRGVQVRLVCNQTVNTSLFTTPYIYQTPTSHPTYMHNKFIIRDVASSSLATVLTGSTNWTQQQLNTDQNNMVIVQDQSLAKAYQVEFDEFYIDHKYSNLKSNNTPHEFKIGGKRVELYFGPTDNYLAEVKKHVATANNEVYVAMSSFTRTEVSYTIVDSAVQKNGAYFAGVGDNGGTTTTVQNSFKNNGVDTMLVSGNSGVFHHKYIIIDANDPCSDPMVITGSSAISNNAESFNDENTLIIHDSTIANLYYQEFAQRYADASGTLQAKAYKTCFTGINYINVSENIAFELYPNPVVNGNSTIRFNNNVNGYVSVNDITGKEMYRIALNNQAVVELSATNLSSSMYFVTVNTDKGTATTKWMINK